MKKIIYSLSVIVAVAALVAGVTTAFYNDEETSSGNVLAAGAIDLGVDNASYYNGLPNPGTSWALDWDLDVGSLGDNPATDQVVETDFIQLLPRLFFNFDDLKPGDWGEDTISLHVKDNESWACMDVSLTSNDDNGINEPEGDDGDVTDGPGNGELQNYIQFVWWADDGDNVLEDNEVASAFVDDEPLANADDFQVVLADSTGNGIFQPGTNNDPLAGNTPYYIGKAWCFGELTLTPVTQGLGVNPTTEDGISCDGSGLNNITQTDSVTGDISFSAVQERHQPDFKCDCDPTGSSVVSDTSNTVVGDEDGFSVALTFIHSAWTASIPGATWIWEENPVQSPTTDETYTFVKTFNVSGTVTSAVIDIATDNFYTLKINGVTIGSEQANENNFQLATQDQYVVTNLVTGANTIEVIATNKGLANSTPASNPAGVLYKLTYVANNCR